MKRNVILIAAACCLGAATTQAQAADTEGPGESEAAAFTGTYAGAEVGVHEHHFFLNVTNVQTGVTDSRYYRKVGVGGGAFIGHDFALGSRLRAGVEAGISIGGNNPVAHFPDGTYYTQHPHYGYRATGKLGYLLNDRLMAYGTFGYGGHRYRLSGTAHVADAHEWGSSFTIGAGIQYRLSRNADVRLDFRHLDNQMSHWLIGVPIRF